MEFESVGGRGERVEWDKKGDAGGESALFVFWDVEGTRAKAGRASKGDLLA